MDILNSLKYLNIGLLVSLNNIFEFLLYFYVTGDLITIIRYQNSPCKGISGDEGTCLSDANDCERRKGTNIGTCARGLSTCCLCK